MMVQNASEGEARFISTVVEHNALCGQFARAFGNDHFERPEPFEEMVYMVSHHDRGWDEWDAEPGLDPESRLPCGLTNTPAAVAIEANRRSPEFNERKHPFCGLLASMHSWGLFNARYGYSEFRVRKGGSTSVPIAKDREEVAREMLEGELARQQRLKATLAADSETRGWDEESRLMQNYKQLQFFDTLALYFNLRHERERQEEIYVHVPRDAETDAEVTVRPVGDGTYSLSPFPFEGDRLVTQCAGRYVRPIPDGDEPESVGEFLRSLPTEAQIYTFVAG